MTAWDCIAAHETGLQTLGILMRETRKKTNEDPIHVPYRNGILHGRELNFDNKIVAAKCWAAIFSVRDLADAILSGKKIPKTKEEVSWSGLLNQLAENNRNKKIIDEWRPRSKKELGHLLHGGEVALLPSETPEFAVAEFMKNWCKQRFGLIAEALLYFDNTPTKKRIILAKEDFENKVPISFTICDVEDLAPATSQVDVEIIFNNSECEIKHAISVRTIYLDSEKHGLVRSDPNGKWKIVQNSFGRILWSTNV